MKRLLTLLFFSFVASQIPPDGSIIPCDLLYLRKDCGQDFVCGSFELSSSNEQYVAVPQASVRSTNAPPADTSKIVTFTFRRLYGNYPTSLTPQNNFSEVHLFIDGLSAGLSLGMQISYDWTGDGVFDRVEVVKDFAPDNIFGNYQDTNRQVTGASGLVSATGAWGNFVGGILQLKIWQAFLANGTINVGTNKRSFLRVPHLSTYALPGGTVAGCEMNSTTSPATNKVVFLLETVQDFYLNAANQAIIDVFKQAGNVSLTVGIITSDFGLDGTIKSKINTALLDPSWNFEVACNGWNYEDISLLPYAKQLEALTNCSGNIEGNFGSRPYSFIAPSASPSTYTLRRAIQAAGYTHFNTLKSVDPGPYAFKNSMVYRYHSGAMTYTTYDVGAPAATTFTQIQTQLSLDGYAVVSMTGAEFATGMDQDVVDTAQIQQLRDLLNMVKAANYNTVTLSQVNADAVNRTKTGVESVDCNCVAFRLDDVQDYFLARAQRAVINTFQSKLAPLTIGIIGNYYGIANVGDPGDMTQFVLNARNNATVTPCFDLEIAHHGYLHEDFSSLDQATQVTRLNNAINVINTKTGVRPRVFLPPFNLFNQFTLPALNATQFTHLTSQTDLDPGPFDYVRRPYGLYRFPIGASTSAYQSEDYFLGVSAQTTFSQIRTQLDTYGFSVVMMHPQEYSDRYENKSYIADSLLQNQINELSNLIDLVRQAGIRMVVVGEIQDYFGRRNETDPCRYVTTPPATTGQATTGQPTTAQATTAQSTTAQSTTGQVNATTGAAATTAAAAVTTRAATTGNVATTASATTSSPVATTAAATTAGPVATTAAGTTGQVATSEEIESSASVVVLGALTAVFALLL